MILKIYFETEFSQKSSIKLLSVSEGRCLQGIDEGSGFQAAATPTEGALFSPSSCLFSLTLSSSSPVATHSLLLLPHLSDCQGVTCPTRASSLAACRIKTLHAARVFVLVLGVTRRPFLLVPWVLLGPH